MTTRERLKSIVSALILSVTATLALSGQAWGYRLYTDAVNGGNPKLAKKTYQVFIQANADNPAWRDEVTSALDKWKAELGPRGIDLQLQAGDPPRTPIDRKAFDAEVVKYNVDPNPDLSRYPEIAKSQAKQDSVSIHWDTTENIQKRGSTDIGGGLANSYWSLDQNGKADTIDVSDIFIPSDPKGGTADVRKVQVHNVSMHELAHPAGFTHYTKGQTGQVMQDDATLFTGRIEIKPEDIKGLDAIYGPKPRVKVQPKVEQKQASQLPDAVRKAIPSGADSVWEYSYGLTWEGGGTASYFQVETGSATVYLALGSDGLSDWLSEAPMGDERYFEFFADTDYLGAAASVGTLALYSPNGPGSGWLVNAGSAERGIVPVPEPSTWSLLGIAALAIAVQSRRKQSPPA